MFKTLLLCVLVLATVACAGPMTSSAALQERGQDGGTVRIIAPSYPPNSDTQASASAEMEQVCRPRAWMVVDVKLQDANGPTGIQCIPGVPCQGTAHIRNQQVDLKFVCVAK